MSTHGATPSFKRALDTLPIPSPPLFTVVGPRTIRLFDQKPGGIVLYSSVNECLLIICRLATRKEAATCAYSLPAGLRCRLIARRDTTRATGRDGTRTVSLAELFPLSFSPLPASTAQMSNPLCSIAMHAWLAPLPFSPARLLAYTPLPLC